MQNIVLIGFSGTGKTTVGKLLAERLGYAFIDIDHEIERNCGMSVEEIFHVHGEEYFRGQERMAIRNMLNINGAVIATGGGAVLSTENVSDLKSCGTVIWLQAPAERILGRIERDTVARPLLNKPDRLQIIRKMLQERNEKYSAADFSVETGDDFPWDVSEKIMENLSRRGFRNQ